MAGGSEATTIKALDGGWGWVIVACVFMMRALSFAAVQSIGVSFDVLMEEFNCTRSEVGLMAGISLSIRYFLGPVVSILQTKFGTRPVAFIGAGLTAIGFIFASFSNSIYLLYGIFGVIGGVGMSLIYLPTLVVISFYFKKRRTFATAIAGIGSYFGCFGFPYLIRFLIDTYGWRGAFFIVGGIILNSLPAAMLLRPAFSLPKKKEASDEEENTDKAEVEEKPSTEVKAPETKVEPKKGSQFAELMKDLYLMFKIPAYSLFVLVSFILMSIYFMPQLFVKEYGRAIGLPMQQTVILQSLVGPGNIIGRPIISYVCDRIPQYKILVYCSVMIIVGVVMSIVTLFPNFYFMAFFAFQNAFFIGATQSLQTPILADILPLEKLGFAFGIVLCAEGIGTLVGPPLLVLFPTYSLSFTCSGLILIAGGFVFGGPLYIMRFVKYCRDRRRVSPVPTEDTEIGTK